MSGELKIKYLEMISPPQRLLTIPKIELKYCKSPAEDPTDLYGQSGCSCCSCSKNRCLALMLNGQWGSWEKPTFMEKEKHECMWAKAEDMHKHWALNSSAPVEFPPETIWLTKGWALDSSTANWRPLNMVPLSASIAAMASSFLSMCTKA